ncbi:MAG TPA: PAS domain S-box protein, partial [Thermodesulfobacteriota bacterium]|nr:PAS domain S-box protein [Thermodesulfobacteriota bacterium]
MVIEKTRVLLAKILPSFSSIRRRIFFLLGGMSIGALLLADLIWFPSAIKEIRQAQGELRCVSVRFIRDQIQMHIEESEADLRDNARRFRFYLAGSDREGLRLTAQQLLHGNSSFEEVGILDGNGKEILRLSRRTVITDLDLADRSASSLFREGTKQETHWEPVTITETSEPRVALTVRLPGFSASSGGLVYGVINLKSLWHLAREFKLNYEGRVYIVEERGRLIAAADPSVVLRQISFADRPMIQQLTDPRNSADHSFVEGDYFNEKGIPVTGTGLLLSRPQWGVVVEQPRSALFAPIRRKIWFLASLSFLGLLLSFGLAQMLSRRFTRPIVRLRKGAEQIGAGNLDYRVPIETRDEIGQLASQFNHMAEQLHLSHQATLSALSIPIISQLGKIQEVLDDVTAKVMTVTGAEAASIRIMDAERQEFVSSVYRGFSEAYIQERPTRVKDETGVEKILHGPEPFISEDILNAPESNGNPLATEGFRSVAYLPLMAPQWTFGLMILASRQPGRFSLTKADTFRAIAHQISLALENAHLFSAHKQAEVALQKNEDRLRAIFNSVRAGILIIDPETHVIVDVNPVAMEMISASKDQIVGSICHKYVCPAEKGRCPVTDLGQGVENAERLLLRADGKQIPIIKTVSVVNLGGRNHLIESFIDITEHKRMENALKESEEKFRTISNTAADAILLMDDEGRINYWNSTAEKIFGYQSGEAIGKELHSFLAPARYREEFKKGFARFRQTGQGAAIGSTIEFFALRKDGTEFPMEVSTAAISLAGQWHAVGIIRDITERKRKEKELTALQEQLRQSQKMEAIGQLAGGVAHDFNNLLTVIRGYSQLALGELQEGGPLWANIDEVRKAADRAAELTRQLLAFSRRQILEFKTVNLNNLIQAMEKMVRRIIGEDVELIIHGGKNLGSIKTDPGQMEQVIMNIVVNARDAMPSGGKLILETDNVYLDEKYAESHTSVKPGYYVKLSVSDTGCGMTREIRERVFEPFFTTKAKDKGTG